MLSVEAFDIANDSMRFSKQLKHTDIWQPKRLFFNTSSWFYKSKKEFDEATKGKLTNFDVGVYYPLKGLSNNELASMASSQHLCQGFGRVSTRGSQNEYVEFLKGTPLLDKNDVFSGINTTWNRIEDGGAIGAILYEVEANFNFTNPEVHIPQLLKAYEKIQNLKDSYWRSLKSKQLLEIIEACLGLYVEAVAEHSAATPNASMELAFDVLNRSSYDIELTSLTLLPSNKKITKEMNLLSNEKQLFKEKISIGAIGFSSPYWLTKKASLGMYVVDQQKLIGKPETPRPLKVQFNLLIENQPITLVKEVVRRYAERDKGEILRTF